MSRYDKEREAVCVDCGHAFTAIRDNTRRCQVCRVLADVLLHLGDSAKCRACGKEFAILRTAVIQNKGKGNDICGECSEMLTTYYDTEGDCGLCGKHTTMLLGPDIAVCRPCSTDQYSRDPFLRALKAKRLARMEASRI